MSRPRREGSFQWLALVAAVVLGVLIVVGLMSSRLTHRGGVNTGAASSAATATPVGDYGPAPAGVNLIWVHDPNHADWLIGFDWSGKPRGTIKLDPGLTADPNAPIRMAPDGQSFATGLDAKGGPWQFLDRLGRLAFSVPPNMSANPPYGVLWADDSRHVCATTQDPVSSRYELRVTEVGHGATTVTEVARDAGVGQATVYLAACSVLKDRVIAVGISETSPAEVWVLQESDGKVLSHHTYAGVVRPAVVVASGDGEYLAEIAEGGNSSQIRRVSDWSVVATVANAQVLRFSGDDSRAFVAPIDSHGHTTAVAEVDWQTGRALWTVDKTVFVPDVHVIPELGSPAFAVAVMAPGNTAAPFTYTVTIVGGDGTAVDLGSYQIAF